MTFCQAEIREDKTMPIDFNSQLFQRSRGRRREDQIIRDLLKVGQIITSEINMNSLFKIIIEQTNEHMGTEQSSIFVYDDKADGLRSFHSSDLGKAIVQLTPSAGIAGWVFTNKEPLIINNIANDRRFNAEIDGMPGLKPRSVLCIPLINGTNQCVGAYQTFNKRSSFGVYSDFTQDDMELLYALSSFVVIAIENSKIYEGLKSLDKAKERVINHLSHEIKTPLAIMSVNLERISKKIHEFKVQALNKNVDMVKRNVKRLLNLQSKIDDILNEKSYEERFMMMHIIEGALGYVEAMIENDTKHKEIMEEVSNYISSYYNISEITYENIHLCDFLQQINKDALAHAEGRDVEIVSGLQEGITLLMDRTILEKVCAGLLKNAIENTPDGGSIEVRSHIMKNGVRIAYKDYGIGITSENQKMIFGGFFHTQDTLSYSSKEPYAFNAGGTGSDLLRMKAFSERCGFTIDFKSKRCKAIPADSDVCAGQIAKCNKIQYKTDCSASGWSEFIVNFPPKFLVR